MNVSLHQALSVAVSKSGAPGGVAYVGDLERKLFKQAVGFRQTQPAQEKAREDTVYDLASLTKVVATTTAVMRLRETGRLALDQPVREWIPDARFDRIRIWHLLTHSSGLPPHLPLYADPEVKSLDDAIEKIAATNRLAPPGQWRFYSDLGFMLLGKVVGLASKSSLDSYCGEQIFKPLGMEHTAFNPPELLASQCAATEIDPDRDGVLVGKVHDENAYALGGATGHAGLFSTAEDLATFCRAWLTGRVLPSDVIDEMTRLGRVPSYPWQGLGWKMDPWMSGAEGFLNSRTAVGHTGWTGTSIWMDRRSGYFTILLGNTCHPTRAKRDSTTFRRIFHLAASSTGFPDSSNAHTGLDRVLWDAFSPFAGKKIALLTHTPARDQFGRSIVNVFSLPPSVRVVRIYSPEHGFLAQAEAGEKVASQSGTAPITSLYGERTEPSAQELSEVDAFVVDLCDVGARYYTYMATMKKCMAACAAAKVPVHVLDRPNPIGGTVLEGPIAEEFGSGVCCAPLPIRHGMTLGEIALFFQKTFFAKSRLELTVHRADNWPRSFLFRQCALPWNPPSPNIPAPDTALLYVGMCLFEGVNLNEGRGTQSPFQLVGAPWLDASGVLADLDQDALAGCRVEPVTYTPVPIPGKASTPRYQDRECGGLFVSVVDPHAVRSFSLAVEILAAAMRRHADLLEWRSNFDVLAGGPWLRGQIMAGARARDIVAATGPALIRFDAARPKLYLTWEEMLKQGKVQA